MTYLPPSSGQQIQAILLALLCSLLFLGTAVLPTNCLVPYPPEALEPLKSEALAAGSITPAELLVGNVDLGDKYNQSLAWDRILGDRLRQGEFPLWTRDIAGGVPFVPQMAQVYQPWNLLLLVVPSTGIYGIWYLLHMVLFGFFAYRFCRRLGTSHVPGLLGMVAVVLGLWTQAQVHHNVILTAALPAFAILSCVHHLVVHRDRNLLHVVLLALGTGLTWLSGFAPVSLQISYLAVAFALVLAARNPKGHRLRPLVLVAAAMGIALLLAAAQLLPVLLASAESSRTVASAQDLARTSLRIDHLLTLLWPDLLAWPADRFYGELTARHQPWAALALLPGIWDAGFNYKETAFAVGIAPLLIGFLGCRRGPGVFFAIAAVIGLLLALAPWGILQLTGIVPFARAGDLKRFVFLFALCAPVLAALGAERFLRWGAPAWLQVTCITVAAASALWFTVHLASLKTLTDFYCSWCDSVHKAPPGTMASWIFPDEPLVNRDHLQGTFLLAFLVAGLVFLALRHRDRAWALLVLVLLTIVELAAVGRGTIVPVANHRVTEPPRILQPVLESHREDQPRPRLKRLVLPPHDPNVFLVPAMPNLGAYWGIEDLGAYSPLPKKAMEELFSAIEPRRGKNVAVAIGGAGVSCFRLEESLTHPLLDVLGIEWILTNKTLSLSGLEDRTPKGLPPPHKLYRRTTCLPRATFLTMAVVLRDPEARLKRLGSRDHEPRQAVVLEDEGARTGSSAKAIASIGFRYHRDEEVALKVTTDKAGYLRLADPYDPGWTVTVNGNEQEILVADHYLRAVWLPPGEHEVVFRYDGASVAWPQRLSLLGLLVLMAGAGLAIRRPRLLDGEGR